MRGALVCPLTEGMLYSPIWLLICGNRVDWRET